MHRATVAGVVLKLGYTSVIFVDLGVKVDGTHYCDLLLSHFENRSIFGEVMDKSLESCFLTHGVYV